MDTAHEIAMHIAKTAKEGVRIQPEDLEPVEEEKEQSAAPVMQQAIPEGTVLGDGHIKDICLESIPVYCTDRWQQHGQNQPIRIVSSLFLIM